MSEPIEQRALITSSDPDAGLCTIDGTDHDYRPYAYRQNGRPWTSLRCVWCHVVACGDYGEADPCIEPYHHAAPHRTAAGRTWPIGGTYQEDGK